VNYLAHLFLAENTPESMIGNLAGDFVKGPVHGHDAYTEGIRQRRRVDAFTDNQPGVAAFRRVLIPDHGHSARIISDVFFDHCLAADFKRYSSESLEQFLERAFTMMHGHPMPARLEAVLPRMRMWMLSYREIDSIRIALTNLSKRLSRTPHLETATHHLIDSRIELERRFHDFFPDVVAFSSK